MTTYQTAIIAIGTELTSGQIANSNAGWLATRLTDLGFETTAHVTVPDDHALIKDALAFCERHCDFLFITGGLGPTTDDFTRDVVAAYAGQKLVYHADAFERIREILAARGFQPTESQKRQCWFPEKSKRLHNPAGTADAFSLELRGKHIWVLPGPPKEIEAVWTSHIETELQARVPAEHRTRLFVWQTQGKPEAEIGELVEAALDGSGLKTGYRAERPIIETKIWVPALKTKNYLPWLVKVEKALEPWLVARPSLPLD